MLDRKKILIIERDDFLREILGNLLHKKGFYIENGFSVQDGIDNSQGKNIELIILGTSCDDYKGKKSINFIKKNLGHVDFFILNNTDKETGLVEHNNEIKISELSIKDIIKKISHM